MMVWNNLTVITVHSHGPGPGLASASAFGSLHRCIGRLSGSAPGGKGDQNFKNKGVGS